MDDFTQKMVERAKMRREKLNNQLNQAGLTPKLNKYPLQENNSNNQLVSHNVETLEKGQKRADFDGKEMSKKLAGKSKLQRLGELYSDDPDLSSPISRSEETLMAESTMPVKAKCRLGRLNELASTINQWEDDLTHANLKKDKKEVENQKPRITCLQQKATTAQITLDKSVVNSLESQGYCRAENSSLVYEFEKKTKRSPRSKISPYKMKDPNQKPSPKMGVSSFEKRENVRKIERTNNVLQKAALFENKEQQTSIENKSKDPAELTLAERKALFEKNKGEVLLPKVAFATSLPAKMRAASPKSKMSDITPVESTNKNLERLEREKELEVLKNRWNKKAAGTTSTPSQMTTPPMSTVTSPVSSVTSPIQKYKDSPETLKTIRDIKKIIVSPVKEGRLYPSLSDIDDENISGCSSSSAHSSPIFDDSKKNDNLYLNMSFGDILAANEKTPATPPQKTLRESSVLNEMDAVLDAALDDNLSSSDDEDGLKNDKIDPTGAENSDSFEFKRGDNKTQTHNITPLIHTVSFYRRQQSSLSNTPMKTVNISSEPETTQSDSSNFFNLSKLSESEAVQKKIDSLLTEIGKQQTIISQASNLLSVCLANIEFSGSEEQVEGERLLLLAAHKRQACLNEIQRLRVEGSLKPKGNNDHVIERGDIHISNIAIPLKREAIRAMAADENMQYFVCLVKCDERVVATPVVMTSGQNLKGNILTCPGELKLENLYGDFTATVEVYHLVLNKDILPHHIKYHLPGKKEKKLLTPLKGKKSQSRLVMPSVQSPAGPNAVRSTSFQMCGYFVFSLRELKRTQWSLNKVPFSSPVEGSIHMKIETDLKLDEEYRGFLTMFEDIAGLGSWRRHWCVLSSHTLSYWKYPDEETKKIPLGSIDLRAVKTEQVGVVAREICARLHTFLLETTRARAPNDADSLVTIVDEITNTTCIRHLLSADTKQDRIEWCNKINRALALLRAWGCNN